ncbi:uncharacterized protein LOC110039120 [Phalaenopsis equestris]|uniref:uncharacterized protein LOC110039120 n=1 Tax=Phalaenopsis equestris TaxID=78828 RepID=UPI0009E5E80F|nr:uncharacterized protein LOC110039120 [Phalaenopsis equestris]
MHDPSKGYMDAMYQLLRYLKSALGKLMIFKKNGHVDIKSFCDSNSGSCVDDMRSTLRYCMFVGGNLISWKSKKQIVVARSTAMTEGRAMTLGVAGMMWLKVLLVELKVDRGTQMILWCGNKSALLTTRCNMIEPSMWKLIGSSSRKS